MRRLTDEEREKRKNERRHRYYLLHREELKEKNRKWRAEHPEKINEYNLRRQSTKKSGIAVYNSQYYKEHRKKLCEYAKNWRKTHPEKVKEYSQRQQENRQREAEERRRAKLNPERQASIFRDPQAAAHFKWLAEHVKRKKSGTHI